MQDAAAEARLCRERVIDVERIHIRGDGDEPLHVLVRERLRERDVLTRLEVVDAFHVSTNFFNPPSIISQFFLEWSRSSSVALLSCDSETSVCAPFGFSSIVTVW